MHACPKCGQKLISVITKNGHLERCDCGYSHVTHAHHPSLKVVRSVARKEPVEYPSSAIVTIVVCLGLLAVFLAMLFL